MPAIPGDDRGCQGNGARCAIELALLDAFGKHFAHPVSDATKLLAHDDLYEPKAHVRYSGAITSAEGFKARMAAWKMWIYGFKQLKIKVGIDGQNDVERVGLIRSRAGRKIDLRVDANEAWTPGNVCEKILELKPFRISSVEQPLPHAEVAALREVRPRVGVPIMLDESLCGMIDAERAFDGETCDLFNLRLSKCGGFIPSLRLAQFARRHKIGLSARLPGRRDGDPLGGGPAFRRERQGDSLSRRLLRSPSGPRSIGDQRPHLRLGRLGAGSRWPGPGGHDRSAGAWSAWRCGREVLLG